MCKGLSAAKNCLRPESVSLGQKITMEIARQNETVGRI